MTDDDDAGSDWDRLSTEEMKDLRINLGVLDGLNAKGLSVFVPGSDICDRDVVMWSDWEEVRLSGDDGPLPRGLVELDLTDLPSVDRVVRWLADEVGLEKGCTSPLWSICSQGWGGHGWALTQRDAEGETVCKTFVSPYNGGDFPCLEPLDAEIWSRDRRFLPDGSRWVDRWALKLVVVDIARMKRETKSFTKLAIKKTVQQQTGVIADGDEEMSDKKLIEKDLSSEAWREYDFGGRIYRIVDPVKLFIHPEGTTHRVVDSKGIAHCIPAPGTKDCVLRWQSREAQPKVSF